MRAQTERRSKDEKQSSSLVGVVRSACSYAADVFRIDVSWRGTEHKFVNNNGA
jgi:hypothetical protein